MLQDVLQIWNFFTGDMFGAFFDYVMTDKGNILGTFEILSNEEVGHTGSLLNLRNGETGSLKIFQIVFCK